MRFGLIGCGGIGRLRAEALAGLTGHTLAAAADVDERRAADLAARYGGTATGDWHTLLDRGDIDAIIVSTPPSLHASMCIKALEAGKHVLCEKPLARTPAECRAMLDAAEKSSRFLATGFNYRFYPSALKARELLDAGVIGTLDHIRSYTGYSATAHDHDWLHDADVMGGGALRDNGIHLIDLTHYFLGDVAEVKGFATNAVWEFDGCEDNGFALLRSTAGRIASLQASWTEWRGYRLLVELYGARGCIRMWCFPMMTEVVRAETRGGKTQRRRYLFPMTHVMEKLRSYRWVVVRSFMQEFEAFADAVQGRPSAVATGFDGLRAVEIAYAATHTSVGQDLSYRL